MSKIRIPQTPEFIRILVQSCNDMLEYFLKHDIKFTTDYCYGYIESIEYEYILDGQKTRFKANVFSYETNYTFFNKPIQTKEYRIAFFDSIEDFLCCIFIKNKHKIEDLYYKEAKKIYFKTLKDCLLDMAKRNEEEKKEQEEKKEIYNNFLCIPTDFLDK